MVPILLKALGDPNKFTEAALDKLLSTAFIHYIDGPSLALVFPYLTHSDKAPPNHHSWLEREECVHSQEIGTDSRVTGKSHRSTRSRHLPYRAPPSITRHP